MYYFLKTHRIKIFFLTLSFFLGLTSINANEICEAQQENSCYYVSPQGTGNGSFQAPSNFSVLENKIEHGDIIYLLEGEYTQPYKNYWGGVSAIINLDKFYSLNTNSGQKKVKITAYPDDNVIINGNNNHSCFYLEGKNSVEISNIKFKDCRGSSIRLSNDVPSTNITIKNNTLTGLYNNDNSGFIYLHGGSTNINISNNHFTNLTCSGPNPGNCYSIIVFESANISIENNLFENLHKGIYYKHGESSLGAGGFTSIKNNTFRNIDSSGGEGFAEFRIHQNRVKIENNLFDNAGRISVHGEDGTDGPFTYGTNFTHNTFVNTQLTFNDGTYIEDNYLPGLEKLGAKNISIYSNIFHNSKMSFWKYGNNDEYDEGINLKSNNNCFYNSNENVQFDFFSSNSGTDEGISRTKGGTYTLSEWKNLGYDTSSIEEDPQFISTQNSNYLVEETSPCNEKGFLVEKSNNTDYENNNQNITCEAKNNANCYYVDKDHPQASDSNSGTYTSQNGTGPFKTIQHAVEMLQPGDIIYVRKSNQPYFIQTRYRGIPYGGITFLRKHSGTADNPVTLQAYPGEKVTINQQKKEGARSNDSAQNGLTSIYIYDASNVIISGFEITNGGLILTGYGSGTPPKNITIKNNHIYNIYGGENVGGIRLDSCENCIVEFNKIHDIYDTRKTSNTYTNQPYGLHSGIHGYGPGNNTIKNNIIYNVKRGIFQKEAHETLPSHNIQYNYFFNVSTAFAPEVAGYGSPSHKNAIFANNIVVGGAGVAGKVHETKKQSSGLKIYNNIFYDAPIISSVAGIKEIEIYNNIVHSVSDWGITVIERTPQGSFQENYTSEITYLDNNLYYNISGWYGFLNRSGYTFYQFSDFSKWQHAYTNSSAPFLLENPDQVTTIEDPLFVDIKKLNFTLQNNSPALHAGRFGENIGVKQCLVGNRPNCSTQEDEQNSSTSPEENEENENQDNNNNNNTENTNDSTSGSETSPHSTSGSSSTSTAPKSSNSNGEKNNSTFEIPACIPSYQYSTWSSCENNSQSRTVTDLNKCSSKKIETRTCQIENNEIENQFLNAKEIILKKTDQQKVYTTNLKEQYNEIVKSPNKIEDDAFIIIDENTKENYLAKIVDTYNGSYFYSLKRVDNSTIKELKEIGVVKQNIFEKISRSSNTFVTTFIAQIISLSIALVLFLSIVGIKKYISKIHKKKSSSFINNVENKKEE